MFTGRQQELAQLEKAYDDEGFKLFLVHGQRGAGKTTLLEEFCRNKAAVFFTVQETSSRANLNSFSAKLLRYFGDNKHAPFQFWDDALSYVVKAQAGFRMIIVIDGFDILAGHDTAFMGIFARVIENEMRASDIFLVITCEDTEFLKASPVLRYFTGGIRLGKFLTDENVARLKEHELKHTSGMGQVKFIRVPAERVILSEGVSNSEMYKIISGRAVCCLNYGTDNEYMLGTFKEGRTFGEYSLLTGKPGIYTVYAFTDMLLLRIGRGDFPKFIETNAMNAVEIMRNMAAMMNVMKFNIDMLTKELQPQ